MSEFEMPRTLADTIQLAQQHMIVTIIIGAVCCCIYICCCLCCGRYIHRKRARRKKQIPNKRGAASRGIAMTRPKPRAQPQPNRGAPKQKRAINIIPKAQPKRIAVPSHEHESDDEKAEEAQKNTYGWDKKQKQKGNIVKPHAVQQSLIPKPAAEKKKAYAPLAPMAAGTGINILIPNKRLQRDPSQVDYNFLLQQQNQYNEDNDMEEVPPPPPPPPADNGAGNNQTKPSLFNYSGGIGGGAPQQKFNF